MILIDAPDCPDISAEIFGEAATGKVTLRGTGHQVQVGSNCEFKNAQIEIKGRNNRLIIGDGVHFRGRILFANGSDQTVRIGARSTFADVYLLSSEGKNITIGEDCMFSREIEVRSTDAHSIIDIATGNRMNRPGDIVIGDHVWVGLRSVIQPGVRIASDVVIGALSFVSRSIEESSVLAAGAPAEIKKRGITWDRRRIDKLPPDERWLNIIRHDDEV